MAPRRSNRNRKQAKADTKAEAKPKAKAKAEKPSGNNKRSSNEPKDDNTIGFKLKLVGIDALTDLISSCNTLQEEFRAIKKAYFRTILVVHPDKGGDPEVFRSVNTAFEALRDLFESNKITSFFKQANESVDQTTTSSNDSKYSADRDVPSWSFYSNAAEDDMPLYKIEPAVSGRSKCRYSKCPLREGEEEKPAPILKGTLRVGILDRESGKYGRWCHLGCWRVPKKVWQGLPDPELCLDESAFRSALSAMNHVVLCGFNELPHDAQSIVVEYVMDKENWAQYSKKQALQGEETKRALPEGVASSTEANKKQRKAPSTERIKGRRKKKATSKALSSRKFLTYKTEVAKPESETSVAKASNQLAVANSAFNGKTVVLTGVFPSVGGGCGLNQGKDRLKAMLEGMGAKVRSSVSGKTDMVIVGQDPGMRKVIAARAHPKCRLVGIQDVQLAIENGETELEKLPEPKIESFSTGWHGNALKIKDHAEPSNNDQEEPSKEEKEPSKAIVVIE